jgi:hypothetical protein
MAKVREVGKAGEKDAGIDPNKPKERIPSRSGTAKYRILDDSDAKTMTEIKNRAEFRITPQIRDMASEAFDSTRELIIKLRPTTIIGPKAQEFINENAITIRPIGEVPPVELKIEIPFIP